MEIIYFRLNFFILFIRFSVRITKDKNAPLIEQCTGIKGYKAKEEQRRQLFSLINRDNYIRMKEYVAQLSQDDRQKNSSNFIKLLNNLHCEDGRWIQEFNEKLEC